MNTHQNKTGEELSSHSSHVVRTYYRVAWINGSEQGEERDVYTSFTSAVQIAEMLQQAAADRPINVRFSVIRKTGQKTKTVYRCQ
jgi:hypothetical protein